ncbi:D-alanine--D-alanine ligase family protein [Corynebacterium diphtheriae]|uniref:D-alanine--D-alanine ligase family protein n=1 Tax=Corynebacterium diphtheriae TaxID=1717 RepID=UPI00064CA234|nr:D-alanine--D-alanine ligase family protein [Corynebacterium diphtheriae]OWN11487.1 D-alanine--D-alanine ligase [Corynebacterium belfantii]KLN40946.1 D-alanine--D-alanine ligase [Corynebacterium diphtheriae bv. gravis str. ISS 4060]MBG9262980.1 D-alanine--D-alanine ligase [Corynebacterium diphtheriae bv. gravis]OWM49599.1 D-alanine--D-alanine ligase [Corynebacterium diphtheriae]OWM55841.1 D-alanine--D-alanine ligase [Corynebacterium diphtheriae]
MSQNLSAQNSSETPRIKVAIIYGGRSSEHSVSCVSAGAIMAHLDPQRYEVFPVGITHDGVWTVGESDPSRLKTVDRVMPDVQFTREVSLSVNPTTAGELRFEDGSLYAKVDVVFPVLHGRFGEDGTIQGLFELSGVPYVGTGVLSSACGMDKEFTKKLMAAEGLPVGKEVILRGSETLTEEHKRELGLPVFVKPARGGSSIGISRVADWSEWDAALSLVREHDSKVIVEAEIVGVEVECGVLERIDGSLMASVPAQLQDTDEGDEGFYGFDTKYLDDVVTAHIPAPFDAETTALIQELSLKAFTALSCRGLARVDFFVTDHGPVLNEINTMPGFTPISMYPQVFEATGIGYAQLLDNLIEQALHK